MRTVLAILVGIFLTIALAGCNGGSSDTGTGNGDTAEPGTLPPPNQQPPDDGDGDGNAGGSGS